MSIKLHSKYTSLLLDIKDTHRHSNVKRDTTTGRNTFLVKADICARVFSYVAASLMQRRRPALNKPRH